MNMILEQEYEIEDWVIPVTKQDLFDRIVDMFYDEIYEDKYEEVIKKYINNLSDDDVTRIFYKNNLVEFTRRHIEVLDLHDKIFSSVRNLEYAKTFSDIPEEYVNKFSGSKDEVVKEYNNFVNNQYFMDPNKPPETVIDTLKELNNVYMKYVYIPYMIIDRIHRLKYFQRKSVCIVDTDSNILAVDEWVSFCKEEVLRSDYGRSEENNRFIIINILAYIITATVVDSLFTYADYSNISRENNKFNMKNELKVKLRINLFNCWKLSLGHQYQMVTI